MLQSKIDNITHPLKTNKPINARYCDSFLCKLRGLMFAKKIGRNEALIMVENHEDRINSAIHMFFMCFDIGVIWLNKDMVIVDKVLAKKWRPFYIPCNPAKFIIECHSDRLDEFFIGDQLQIEKE
jgi:uncharacterized membrane protein (UPF0127 family)